MTDLTKTEIEQILGDPSEYIADTGDRHLLKQWAIAAGHNPISVNAANLVQLANWYCEGNKDALDEKLQLTAEIFIKIMEAVSVQGFNVELTRHVVKDEIDQIHIPAIAERVARFVTIPKRLEIVGPTATVLLDGLHHYKTEHVIKIASLAQPIMLVGPAGCGKTTIGQHVATALNLPFYITSTITSEHQLTGFVDGYGKYHTTPFRQAFEFGGVWVADEIDAWDATALLAANSALANGYSVFPDREQPVARHGNFRMIATANTFGNGADRVYIGRNELDAASLDRFAMIRVDYDLTLEKQFALGNKRWLDHCWDLRKKVEEKKIRHVVSSRAIGYGAAALAIEIDWKEAEEMYLFKGMSKSDRDKVT